MNPQPDPLAYDSLMETVVALRLGIEGMAGDRLRHFIDALGAALPTLDPALLPRLLPQLEPLLAAQQRRDLVEQADLLQYEIAPLLFAGSRRTDGRRE